MSRGHEAIKGTECQKVASPPRRHEPCKILLLDDAQMGEAAPQKWVGRVQLIF